MALGSQENADPQPSVVDLERYMELYQQADATAVVELVAALSPALLRFFRSQVSSRQQADDLLQESYLRLLQAKLPVAMEEEHRKNYLFRIATNLARSSRLGHNVPLDDVVSGASPEAHLANTSDVTRKLESLKPRQRELLWLAYVEGFSHSEIAKIVGAKAQSIRPMLARARESLASVLRGHTPVGKKTG